MAVVQFSEVVQWLCDLFVRAFLLTVVALAFRLFLGKAAPSVRHLWGVFTVIALLLLPLFLLLPPLWHIAPAKSMIVQIEAPKAESVVAEQKSIPVSKGMSETVVLPPNEASHTLPVLVNAEFFKAIAAGIGMVFSLVAVIRLLFGLAQVRYFLRHCYRLRDESLFVERERLRCLLGVNSPVELWIAENQHILRVPMTCGWKRPLIVLPGEMKVWSSERIRLVLCHEIAHIQRNDWLYLMLAEIVRVLYAMNPLVWKLVDDLRRDAEMATDDLVIRSGVGATEYATHLVDIAAGLRGTRSFATVPMASERTLTTRVQRLLSPAYSHRSVKIYQIALPIACCLGILLLSSTLFRKAVYAQDAPATSPTVQGKEQMPLENPLSLNDMYCKVGQGVQTDIFAYEGQKLRIPFHTEIHQARQEGSTVIVKVVDNIPLYESALNVMVAVAKDGSKKSMPCDAVFKDGVRQMWFGFRNTDIRTLAYVHLIRRTSSTSTTFPIPVAPEPIPTDLKTLRQMQEVRIAELKSRFAKLPMNAGRGDVEALMIWEGRGTPAMTEYRTYPELLVTVPYNSNGGILGSDRIGDRTKISIRPAPHVNTAPKTTTPQKVTATTRSGKDGFLDSLEEGIKQAKAEHKPIFVEFTGYTVTNARTMEYSVFPHPIVLPELEKYVRVRLYTDDGPNADKNRNYQSKTFKTVALPLYAVLTPEGKPLRSIPYTPDAERFATFLRQIQQDKHSHPRQQRNLHILQQELLLQQKQLELQDELQESLSLLQTDLDTLEISEKNIEREGYLANKQRLLALEKQLNLESQIRRLQAPYAKSPDSLTIRENIMRLRAAQRQQETAARKAEITRQRTQQQINVLRANQQKLKASLEQRRLDIQRAQMSIQRTERDLAKGKHPITVRQ